MSVSVRILYESRLGGIHKDCTATKMDIRTPELIRQFETYISGDEESCVITGLAVDDNCNMYVADACNKRIKVYSKEGNFKLFFAANGPHRVKEPHDLTVLSRDRLAVTDGGDRTIKIYDLKGKYLSSVGKFHDPQGITTNHRNELIVVDAASKSIQIFSPEGTMVSLIRGCQGLVNLSQPKYVATTKGDDIIVTDIQDHSIKVFDRLGTYKFSYQQNASEAFLFHPTGVCVDPTGQVIVADEDHHRLLRIRGDNSKESLLPQGLDYPRAICFPNENTLVVAEYYGAIKMYKI